MRAVVLKISSLFVIGTSLQLLLLQNVFATAAPNSTHDALAEERNATERAFSLFALFLSTEDELQQSDYEHERHVIFKNGEVYKYWIPLEENENETKDSQMLFHHDQYADRISFEFSFGSFLPYEFSTPTCSSSEPKVAKPKVIDFQSDTQELSGSFSVVYDCQRQTAEEYARNVTVSVIVPVVSGLSVLFSLRKTCGGGTHHRLEFGYYQLSEKAATEVNRIPFNDHAKPLISGPHVMSTKLYLHLYPPARTQEFFHIAAKTSSLGLEVIPKGPVFGGVLRQAESTIIHVLYECHSRGKYNISLTIPIHPFNEVRASWTKDCGGGVANGLNVGTGPHARNDVVKGGTTSDAWSFGLHSNTADIASGAPVLNESTAFTDFWLQNDEIPVHLAPPVVTVEHPRIVTVLDPQPDYGALIRRPEEGGLLPKDGRIRIRLRMICKKKGKSLVVVTFPVKSFANVDFAFVKRCKAPRRYVHSGFLRTADSVMMAASVFMVAALGYWLRVQLASEVLPEKPAPGFHRI